MSWILTEIDEFWKARTNKLYGIIDVRCNLKHKFPQSHIPSLSFIAKYMKISMNLSYKKVSWRPMKILSQKMISRKLDYIDFIEKAGRLGYKILQIDEFWTSRTLKLSRIWTTKGKFGYDAYEGPPSKRYSIIAAISENSLELATIREGNTNGTVFAEFIGELSKKLIEKYGERRKAFILTWDGARYHSTFLV